MNLDVCPQLGGHLPTPTTEEDTRLLYHTWLDATQIGDDYNRANRDRLDDKLFALIGRQLCRRNMKRTVLPLAFTGPRGGPYRANGTAGKEIVMTQDAFSSENARNGERTLCAFYGGEWPLFAEP